MGPTWSTGTQSSKITATTSGTTLTATATWLTTSVSRTAQTAQIREQQLLRERQQIRQQQQQLDFEEINLFSALFIVVCLSSEPFTFQDLLPYLPTLRPVDHPLGDLGFKP